VAGNLNLNSTTADSIDTFFLSDTITITRGGGVPGAFTNTVIYSGNGDLQEKSGMIYYNPAGVAEQADAMLIIANTDPTVLPAVNAGDTITRLSDGRQYVAVVTSSRLAFLPHLEIKLRRGDIDWNQK
jgi:hypothetical protein